MIKVILFDCDGLIIRHEKYFTVRLAKDRGIALEGENKKQKEFFNGIFLDCQTGKADLKVELKKNLSLWRWTVAVEELMEYWFSGEAKVEDQVKGYILKLRENGYKCFLSTNNEKYRAEYLWNVADLKSIFDGFLPSYSIGYLKQDQKFWQQTYKNFPAIQKQEVLVWDDDLANVKSASDFGFNAEFYQDFESFKKIMEEKYQL